MSTDPSMPQHLADAAPGLFGEFSKRAHSFAELSDHAQERIRADVARVLEETPGIISVYRDDQCSLWWVLVAVYQHEGDI